ncbi:MAG: cytochrome C [Acidaminobacter sp.]|uniref:cytochrome-c peroxidase n=1 Tax=Acidaminobacter sp. TaxID=1872102 RepID=UPI00137E5E5B|nr:cytochrome c peroxidase [Acidaminobacter sp.]MZQ99558.1 cytochrome C [Acidaminobacter sp.]
MKRKVLVSLLLSIALIFTIVVFSAGDAELTPMEQLGKEIFFDENLSINGTMSCASCHAPETGFTGADSKINKKLAVYPGAIETRFGNRKPPTAAYAGESPILYFDEDEELWIGGMFWDGRATGWMLGDPLAEQAQGPFLNPLEQAMPDPESIVTKVSASEYAELFKKIWGTGAFEDSATVNYERIARAIASYERSDQVNPFTSKYDYYLKGEVDLTEEEALGLEVFEGKGNCAACHISQPGPEGEAPLFTDFTYDNLGIPKNPNNPFYTMDDEWNPDGTEWIDLGLGGFLEAAGYPKAVYEAELGKFKVPTLRNVDLRPYPSFVKVYGHNGYFKSLEDIVNFYNLRDVKPNKWPMAEYPYTINTDELGNLGLTNKEEAALVAFMKTLSDGYVVTQP